MQFLGELFSGGAMESAPVVWRACLEGFDGPIVAEVRGAAIGEASTVLLCCAFFVLTQRRNSDCHSSELESVQNEALRGCDCNTCIDGSRLS